MMELSYTVTGDSGQRHWILNPNHPSHQENMNEMTPLQRAYLLALLDAVKETIRIAHVNSNYKGASDDRLAHHNNRNNTQA